MGPAGYYDTFGPELSFGQTLQEKLNSIDVTAMVETVAAADSELIHIKAFDLSRQEKKLVIDTSGIVQLGELIARCYLARE